MILWRDKQLLKTFYPDSPRKKRWGLKSVKLEMKRKLNMMPKKYEGSSDFPGGSDGKASAYNAGDLGSIPGWGRSSGEGNGNPLQYSCLENPMDGGAW